MSNTTSITTPVLDDETVAAFERDGVVVLRQVFNPWIDELAKGVEQLKNVCISPLIEPLER